MSANKDGGQAFPHGDPTNGGDTGMTLRDYFASQAMRDGFGAMIARGAANFNKFQCEACARSAYIAADAMLAEREKSAGAP